MREHYMAHYENGEPIKNKDGNIYMAVDQCGPTNMDPLQANSQDAYLRTINGMWLYDPQERMLGPTVQYVSDYTYGGTTYRAGMVECQVVYDRRTQLFHIYQSQWRTKDKGGVKYVEHYQTKENILNGYHVFQSGDME